MNSFLKILFLPILVFFLPIIILFNLGIIPFNFIQIFIKSKK